MDQKAAATYRTQEIMTAAPARLVAMLFDRAVASLNEAIEAIKLGDVERRWRANNRAIEIISHLAMTLDMEKGGQIAQNLDQLYRFLLIRLPQVDLRNDAKPAEEAIQILEPLRATWHELAANGGSSTTAQARKAHEKTDSTPADFATGIQISA